MSAEKSLFPLKGQRLNVVSPEGITVGVHRMPVVADKSSLPPLYHGSGSHIKVGDTVRPHPKAPDPESRRYAFASSLQGAAGVYARGPNTDINGQGVFWGIVHRVGPTEDNEVLKDIHPHGERSWGKEHGHYLSKQFKVLEATHLVDYMGRHTPLGNNSPLYDPPTKKYKQLKFQDIREINNDN
jgi:hypothetical protein